MFTRMALDPKDMPEIAHLVARAAFPDYRGRKFELLVEPSVRPETYWSGGTRTDWRFVRLADMAVLAVAEINPITCAGVADVALPQGVVAVSHHRFCGKDMGLCFHVSDPGLLPLPKIDASEDEQRVLVYTRALKPSGDRRGSSGLSPERWEAAKQSCIRKGWLNRAGAITPAGRNVSYQSDIRPW